MSNIIEHEKTKNHVIKPYHLKSLDGVSNEDEMQEMDEAPEVTQDKTSKEPKVVEHHEPIVQVDEQQNRFIEELLKKSDELSTNIIKLQMQIEKQEDDFNNRLIKELERESQDAYEKGYQSAKDELESSTNEIKDKFLNSIVTLEKEAIKGDDFLKHLEGELLSTSIEVAKEVISKELKNSSSDVAAALCKKLIEELKDAKNIKLKVNPADFDALQEIYSAIKNIDVQSDSAITKGGVIVLSDTGNLDGNISTRLDKVKNLLENEQ